MTTAAILLAAGSSNRFGSMDKLLAMFRGRPLIVHAAETLRELAPDHLIAVVSNLNITSELDGFTCVSVSGEAVAQSTSLRAGIDFANKIGVDRVIITLGDMPFVTVTLLQDLLVKCNDGGGSVASDGVKRSPPACFVQGQFEGLSKTLGDKGAREMLGRIPEEAVVLVNDWELADIDTISDLAHYG